MGRGPRITDEEVNKARALKAEGKTIKEICFQLKRTPPTVYKLLKIRETPL